MEDRDGKKPFVIPKTHTSNKEVLINEKTDSRNVIDLFNDIKSCALEGQFDFRQHAWKSCDTIRNQKLQKLYSEKRNKMRKEQEPVERLAFHLITYRDEALKIANNGLNSEQLSFPIEKCLGNPKDGVHLSRRPDVLLASSGAKGLYRFGLLVCKVLLGKGYATIASVNNNQLPAQLHYDHHFCKIQSTNKDQRQIDDLLANSLIFCYEHENFEPIPYPTQILPIAILWYDLTEKFSPELIPVSTQESQHRNGKNINGGKSIKKKTSIPTPKVEPTIPNKPLTSNSGSWEGLSQESTTNELSITKYPSHFMVPIQRLYSSPSVMISTNIEPQLKPTQQIISSRDPRLTRPKREATSTSSETIPLSPQHLLTTERSLSDGSATTAKTYRMPSDEPVLITKSTSTIYIPLNPLNSSASIIDPRLKTLKPTRSIFYLESEAVKHALQQQKRLNHYYDPKSGLPPKTSYKLVPFLSREVSVDEYQRLLTDEQNTCKFTKHSSSVNYSSLYVSVVDCFDFGLTKPNQAYVDLEQNENRLAYEQIEISNDLIQREKQLNSQQIRLRLREKRQRRMLDKQTSKSSLFSPSLSNSKSYITTGRKLLKDYQIPTVTPNANLSPVLLDFFSREYKNENRSYVKHLLAEMVGIFMEKYHIEEASTDNQTMNCVIDMDLASPASQELRDHDERFRIPTPPPLPPPAILPPLPPSINEPVTRNHTSSSNEPNQVCDDPEFTDRCHKLIEQVEEYRLKQLNSSNLLLTMKTESVIPTEEAILKACCGQIDISSSSSSSSRQNSPIDNNHQLVEMISAPLVEDDSIRSRDEFVKLLTKEAFVSKSSSPVKKQDNSKHSYDYTKHRRRSHDDHDRNNSSNTHRPYTHSSDKKLQSKRSSPQKKLSSNRTVLLSNPVAISDESQSNTDISSDNQNDSQEEPKFKRPKIDSSPNINDSLNSIDQIDQDVKAIVNIPVITDDRDCRHDLNEKRRISGASNPSIGENIRSRSSRSRSKSKDYHREQRRSSTNSHNSKQYSRSSTSSSSNDNQHRRQHQQQQHDNRTNRQYQRKRSPDLPNRRHDLPHESSFRTPISSKYRQRETINDITLPGNFHSQRQPVHHRRYNYNHQSVAAHPRFANQNTLPSSSSLMDYDYPKSPPHRHSISPMSIGDRNIKSSHYHNQSESTSRNYSSSFDSKPSDAIEQLQLILQNKTTDLFDQSKMIHQ